MTLPTIGVSLTVLLKTSKYDHARRGVFTAMKSPLFLLLSALLLAVHLPAQSALNDLDMDAGATTAKPAGAWARLEVVDGDSTFVMSLWPVRITAKRNFKDDEERILFGRYTRAARKVYPYAMQALAMYADVRAETEAMSKRQKRRYLRHQGNEVKEDFSDRLKNLTRTEGKVLVKMIEKETGKSMYDIVRETRGAMAATYWQGLAGMWDYDLKDGYHPGADPLLDEVFLDYDFGHPEVWYQP